jgi:hypothetical protein
VSWSIKGVHIQTIKKGFKGSLKLCKCFLARRSEGLPQKRAADYTESIGCASWQSSSLWIQTELRSGRCEVSAGGSKTQHVSLATQTRDVFAKWSSQEDPWGSRHLSLPFSDTSPLSGLALFLGTDLNVGPVVEKLTHQKAFVVS